MPLHMTKIAYSNRTVPSLRGWLEKHDDFAPMTTRYLPRRHEEMVGGSLYWIIDHALIGRSPIIGFEQRPDARWTIKLEPRLLLVEPRPKRAHQGWRYLADEKAPRDLPDGEDQGDLLPGRLLGKLSKLGLV